MEGADVVDGLHGGDAGCGERIGCFCVRDPASAYRSTGLLASPCLNSS
jgi:hypothetical protein